MPANMSANRCEECLSKVGRSVPSMEVADTGYCGACGRCDEVWDIELLGVYQDRGISSEAIVRLLPRLRQYGDPAFPLPGSKPPMSLEQAHVLADDLVQKMQAFSEVPPEFADVILQNTWSKII